MPPGPVSCIGALNTHIVLYSWEGIRQVRATPLAARHVPERLCGGYVYLGRYIKCSTFTFTFRLFAIFVPKIIRFGGSFT